MPSFNGRSLGLRVLFGDFVLGCDTGEAREREDQCFITGICYHVEIVDN